MSQTVNHTITGDLINFVLPWYNLCSWFSCLVSVTNPTWCTINMSVRSKRWKNGCHTDSLRFLAYSFSISTLDGSSWKSVCFISHNKREKEEKERSYFTQDQDPTQKGSNKRVFYFIFLLAQFIKSGTNTTPPTLLSSVQEQHLAHFVA